MNHIPSTGAGLATEDSIRAFWRAYRDWMKTASDEDMAQVELAMANLQTTEVMPIVRAIRLVLRDERARRNLPPSLVQQLEVANWPAAQATG